MKKGHLFFIMWVSGSGKGTLRTNLKNTKKENIEFLKSYVTREMRPGEVNGDQYWFITQDAFKTAIEHNEFLEYELVHKVAYYGTKQQDVIHWLESGKILFKEIDTKWLKQLHEKYPDFSKNYTSFFIDVPNEVFRQRFFERSPEASEEDFQNRLESAIFEREHASEYCDYILRWDNTPEEVLQEVLEIIHKHSS